MDSTNTTSATEEALVWRDDCDIEYQCSECLGFFHDEELLDVSDNTLLCVDCRNEQIEESDATALMRQEEKDEEEGKYQCDDCTKWFDDDKIQEVLRTDASWLCRGCIEARGIEWEGDDEE